MGDNGKIGKPEGANDADLIGANETVNTKNLAPITDSIIPLLRHLNQKPGSTIPIYDQRDHQWYTLGLNEQSQLVVIMRLPNGASATKVLDVRSKQFLFNPEILNQRTQIPVKEPTPKENQTIEKAALAAKLQIALGSMQEDTRVQLILIDKQHLRPAIKAKAQALGENLANPKRNLTLAKGADFLKLEYLTRVTDIKDSMEALQELINAAGVKLNCNYYNKNYYTTIPAENFARFIVIELLKALTEKLPDADPLREFLGQVQSIREGLFRAHINSPTNAQREIRTIEITIL